MKNIFITIALIIASFSMTAQVGIGTNTPATDAILDLTATNKAFLMTRVANTAAIANPVNGMLIYDNSTNSFKSYQNNAWALFGTPIIPDAISDVLSTNQATYTAAGIDTWIQVTEAEYNAVAAIAGAAKYGFLDSQMSTAVGGQGGGLSITTTPTVPTYGSNLPGSNYIIAMSFVPYNNSTSANGLKLKYAPSTTPTSGLVDYPNNTVYTNPSATYTTGTRVFYVLKKPSMLLPSGTFILGAYYQSGLNLGLRGGNGNRYNGSGGDTNTATGGTDTNPYLMQAIGTTTKSW